MNFLYLRSDAERSGTSGVMETNLVALLWSNTGGHLPFINPWPWTLQEIQSDIQQAERFRPKWNQSDYRLHKAVQVQEVQYPGRTVSISVQIRPLHVLPLGRLERDQCWDGGVDLPGLVLGRGVWRHPQSLSWILIHLPLGHFEQPEKILLHKINGQDLQQIQFDKFHFKIIKCTDIILNCCFKLPERSLKRTGPLDKIRWCITKLGIFN